MDEKFSLIKSALCPFGAWLGNARGLWTDYGTKRYARRYAMQILNLSSPSGEQTLLWSLS